MDIHCDQLIQVLTKKRLINGSWKKDLAKVKNAHAEALSMIPSEWGDEVESHTSIPVMGYWRCSEIFDILLKKKSEAGEAGKSWFGSYKDPLLKKWDIILRAYRKSNVYAAETALLLDQNSAYEIPGLKKEVKLCGSRIGYLNKRILETSTQLDNQRAELAAYCEERGIKGSKPTPQSILDDVNRDCRNSLPSLLSDVHSKIRNPVITRAIEFYREFSSFLGFTLPIEDTAQSDVPPGKLLEHLEVFNAYEGPVSSTAELSDIPVNVLGPSFAAQEEVEAGEIDWGDLDGDIDVEDGGIDWDIGDEVAAAALHDFEDETKVGDNSAEQTSASEISGNDDLVDLGIEMEIDFEMEDGIEVDDNAANDIVVEHSLVEQNSREGVVNDLLELQSFLKQRAIEMDNDEGNAYFMLTRDAPPLVQKQTAESIANFLHVCNDTLAEIQGERLQRLVLLRDSKSAMARLVDAIQSKIKRLESLDKKIMSLRDDLRQLEGDLGKLQPRLEEATRTTKQLQALLEKALGELFKQPNSVRIVGSVNAI